MAPQLKYEIVIMKINYLENVHPQFPQVTLARKRSSPSGFIPPVRHWVQQIITDEKSNMLPNQRFNFVEWSIITGNPAHFTIRGFRYDTITVVFGEELLHWVFHQNKPPYRRVEGAGLLNLNFCSCCLNKQYPKVIECVRGFVAEKDSGNRVKYDTPSS